MSGILKQEDQWPDRVAANREAVHGGPGSFYDGEEEHAHPKHKVLPTIHPQKVQGLYGEDEDHPYDVWAVPSGHGENGWDVISESPKK